MWLWNNFSSPRHITWNTSVVRLHTCYPRKHWNNWDQIELSGDSIWNRNPSNTVVMPVHYFLQRADSLIVNALINILTMDYYISIIDLDSCCQHSLISQDQPSRTSIMYIHSKHNNQHWVIQCNSNKNAVKDVGQLVVQALLFTFMLLLVLQLCPFCREVMVYKELLCDGVKLSD